MYLICSLSAEEAAASAGQWAKDRRQGPGICKFADGSKFSGQWDNDAWIQSMADRALSKLGGVGLTQATAGLDATFLIKVCFRG